MAVSSSLVSVDKNIATVEGEKMTVETSIGNLRAILSYPDIPEELNRLAQTLLDDLRKGTKKGNDMLNDQEQSRYNTIDQEFRAHEQRLKTAVRTVETLLSLQGLPHGALVQHDFQGRDIRQLNEELKFTKFKLQSAEDKISDLKETINNLRTQHSQEKVSKDHEIQKLQNETKDLENTIERLRKEKRTLEEKVLKMETEMKEDKAIVDKKIQWQEEKLEQLHQNYMNAVEKLGKDVTMLKEENRKLKTRDPYKLVGLGITSITNALYRYVHQEESMRKNYYSISDLEHQFSKRYQENDVERRHAAEKRWDDVKRRIGWGDTTAHLIAQLAEYREKGARPLDVPVAYEDFRDAIRIMFNDGEIDVEEMDTISDLYVKCDNILGMRVKSTN